MKITVLAGYFEPEQSADTHLNADIANGLAAKGHDVTVVVPFPTRGVSKERQQEIFKTPNSSEKYSLIRVGKPETYSQGFVLKALRLIGKTCQIYQAARKIDTDVYFVVSTPPFLGYAAARLAKKNKVVYKLQDVFPDSLMHSKNIGERNLLIKLLRKFEHKVYDRVSRIIAISDDVKSTVLSRGVSEEKVNVIYDWIDAEKCIPIPKTDNFLYDRFELDRSAFYVGYAGNIGLVQNVDTIVDAANILKKSCPEIVFLIIGDGACLDAVQKKAKELGTDNVRFFPMQPAENVPYVYSLSDIGLVSLKKGVSKCALPSKTWSVMACGRPVICEIDSDCCLCRIVENNNCGYSVEPCDSALIAAKIEELYHNRELVSSLGANARNYIENNLTNAMAIERYDCVLSAVLEA